MIPELIVFALFIFAAFYSGFYIGYYKREEKPPEIIKPNFVSRRAKLSRAKKEPEPTKEELKANSFYS